MHIVTLHIVIMHIVTLHNVKVHIVTVNIVTVHIVTLHIVILRVVLFYSTLRHIVTTYLRLADIEKDVLFAFPVHIRAKYGNEKTRTLLLVLYFLATSQLLLQFCIET